MSDIATIFNIPVPGSERFEQDTELALTKIRGNAEVKVDVPVAKVGGGTRTLHFAGGQLTGYTDS